MSDLIAITYADEASGRGAFEELDRLQKMEVLTLEDAALAIKDQKGKVKVKQTLENAHSGSAAVSRAATVRPAIRCCLAKGPQKSWTPVRVAPSGRGSVSPGLPRPGPLRTVPVRSA